MAQFAQKKLSLIEQSKFVDQMITDGRIQK